MKKEKRHQLQALLRLVELPAPPPGFTEEVMKETSPLEEGVGVDIHLKEVFRHVRLPEPTNAFTHNVLKSVGQLPQGQRSTPVIGRIAWMSVALFVITCIAVALTYPSSAVPEGTSVYFSWLTDRMVDWTTSFREPILYLEVIILSAGTLLGLEHILRKKLHWNNK